MPSFSRILAFTFSTVSFGWTSRDSVLRSGVLTWIWNPFLSDSSSESDSLELELELEELESELESEACPEAFARSILSAIAASSGSSF